jgi:acyl carrier protein
MENNMDLEVIQNSIYTYIKNELHDGNDFEVNMDIIESGLIDSVKIMKLIAFLEKTFSIEIDLEDVNPDNFAQIATITKFIGNIRG